MDDRRRRTPNAWHRHVVGGTRNRTNTVVEWVDSNILKCWRVVRELWMLVNAEKKYS